MSIFDSEEDNSYSWIQYKKDMIECCKNETITCKKFIKMYRDFIREENNILSKGYCKKQLKKEKKRLEELKEEMKGYELYLAKWRIRKFQDNGGQFKVIHGGLSNI